MQFKNLNTELLRVQGALSLHDFPTRLGKVPEKKALKEELSQLRKSLSEFQERLYAHGRHSVLICLQGMDTSGKDSLVREVFKDFNSRGVVVHNFGPPTTREYRHDFLWRHYAALPERGKFGVFNRSHYENVLATRVHPQWLMPEKLPHIHKVEDIPADFWVKRMQRIRNFEYHLAESGTIVFKFFLHISPEEQRNRLIRRLNRPNKRWKFAPSDLEARKYWQDYQRCYEEALTMTSTVYAPWYVIPADSKSVARVLVARILDNALQKPEHIKEPPWNVKTQGELEAAIEALRQLGNS